MIGQNNEELREGIDQNVDLSYRSSDQGLREIFGHKGHFTHETESP